MRSELQRKRPQRQRSAIRRNFRLPGIRKSTRSPFLRAPRTTSPLPERRMSRNSARTGGIAEIRRNRGPPWKRRPQPGADVAAVAVERAESCADAKMGCGGERESEGKRIGTILNNGAAGKHWWHNISEENCTASRSGSSVPYGGR